MTLNVLLKDGELARPITEDMIDRMMNAGQIARISSNVYKVIKEEPDKEESEIEIDDGEDQIYTTRDMTAKPNQRRRRRAQYRKPKVEE